VEDCVDIRIFTLANSSLEDETMATLEDSLDRTGFNNYNVMAIDGLSVKASNLLFMELGSAEVYKLSNRIDCSIADAFSGVIGVGINTNMNLGKILEIANSIGSRFVSAITNIIEDWVRIWFQDLYGVMSEYEYLDTSNSIITVHEQVFNS